MSSSRITYFSRLDATPDAELSALATAYRFILDCNAKKEAASRQSRQNNARKESNNVSRNADST